MRMRVCAMRTGIMGEVSVADRRQLAGDRGGPEQPAEDDWQSRLPTHRVILILKQPSMTATAET